MALAWESLAEQRKRRLNHKVDLEADDNLTRPVCELSTSSRLVMFAVKTATATIRRTLVTLQFSIRPSPARLLDGRRRRLETFPFAKRNAALRKLLKADRAGIQYVERVEGHNGQIVCLPPATWGLKEETECAVSLGAVEKLDQSQKPRRQRQLALLTALFDTRYPTYLFPVDNFRDNLS